MKSNSLQAIEDVLDFLKTEEQISILTSDLEFYKKVKTVLELAETPFEGEFSHQIPENLENYKLDFKSILRE